LRDVAFCTDAFASPATNAYSERVLASLLWALIFANESWMITHDFPPLYQSGIRWEAEKPLGVSACKGGNGQERFLGVQQIINDGVADCEDLASWRVSELRLGRAKGAMKFGMPPRPGHPPATVIPTPWPMQIAPGGVNALPAFYKRQTGPRSWLYHIVVAWMLPGGRMLLEDPSRVCGMGQKEG
jgi:hypothetical protein